MKKFKKKNLLGFFIDDLLNLCVFVVGMRVVVCGLISKCTFYHLMELWYALKASFLGCLGLSFENQKLFCFFKCLLA